MTAEEKQKMMDEIMQVVDKHVAKSENISEGSDPSNLYGREYGIRDNEMRKWKEEYRRMRVDAKLILDEVRRHPIDVSGLTTSFNLDVQRELLKEDDINILK